MQEQLKSRIQNEIEEERKKEKEKEVILKQTLFEVAKQNVSQKKLSEDKMKEERMNDQRLMKQFLAILDKQDQDRKNIQIAREKRIQKILSCAKETFKDYGKKEREEDKRLQDNLLRIARKEQEDDLKRAKDKEQLIKANQLFILKQMKTNEEKRLSQLDENSKIRLQLAQQIKTYMSHDIQLKKDSKEKIKNNFEDIYKQIIDFEKRPENFMNENDFKYNKDLINNAELASHVNKTLTH